MKLKDFFKRLFGSKNPTMSKAEAREQLRTLQEKYADKNIFGEKK